MHQEHRRTVSWLEAVHSTGQRPHLRRRSGYPRIHTERLSGRERKLLRSGKRPSVGGGAHAKYLSADMGAMSFGVADVEATVRDIGTFVWKAVFPVLHESDKAEWERLIRFLDSARKLGVSLATAEIHMLSWMPEMESSVSEAIATALHSENPGTISAASRSIRHCAGLYENGHSAFAPKELVELLARRVAFRQQPDLLECMDDLAYVLLHFPVAVNRDVMNLLVASLKSWIASLWPLDGGGRRARSCKRSCAIFPKRWQYGGRGSAPTSLNRTNWLRFANCAQTALCLRFVVP